RSAAGRIFDGAATTQLIPASAHPRASPYPVGPASYTTRTGAGSVFNHATVPSGGTLSDRTSPLPTSITPATTDRACTSSPTQLPSFITGASRNCGSTAGPIPTATRANLRARRRVSPYGLAQSSVHPPDLDSGRLSMAWAERYLTSRRAHPAAWLLIDTGAG